MRTQLQKYLLENVRSEFKQFQVEVGQGVPDGKKYCDLAGSGGSKLHLNVLDTIQFYLYGDCTKLRPQLGVTDANAKSFKVGEVSLIIPKISGNSKGNAHVFDFDTKVSAASLKGDDAEDKKKEILKAYETILGIMLSKKLLDAPRKNKVARRARSTSTSLNMPINLIVFGAPGTGKSREIEKLRVQNYREMLGDAATPDNAEKPYFEGYERVTFYPTYSYAQFVGSYKPYMAVVDKDGFEPEDNAKRRKVIAYKFVPGPFLRILAEAVKNPDNNYLFIIEEINRANAASVFGDMFQLLDRKSCGDDEGWSEYAITPSEEVSDWLKEQHVPGGELRIPGNLYIWATMNSADQGVFPLDTAFKRRWDFKYLSLDDKKDNDKIHVACGKEGLCLCLWGDLRKAINHLLARNHVNEDKHLSAYFVKPDGDNVISLERFQMKVLMYLWEDAARMCRAQIFNEGILTFSNLIEAWGKASCSKVDEKGEPSGEDNPLDTVFRFGTDKTEIVKVWKVEANDGAGENAGEVDPVQEQKGDAAVQQEKMPVQTLEAVNPQAVAEGKKEEPAEKKQEVEPANQAPTEPKTNGGLE